MTKIIIIGAGQIGSRHLQALKDVKEPLDILVIDPSLKSLDVSASRYMEMTHKGKDNNEVAYSDIIPSGLNVDLAIIATTSRHRAKVTRELVTKNEVKYLILEKLLFARKSDYKNMASLFKRKKIKTWVNCSMRETPVYKDLKLHFNKSKVEYRVVSGKSAMMTDVIHFLDHIAYLTGSTTFDLDTGSLERKVLKSKRKGYLELSGVLAAKFGNKSLGVFSMPSSSDLHKTVEIKSNKTQVIINEHYNSLRISKYPKWKWASRKIDIPYQSSLTTKIVESILTRGTSKLTRYDESAKLHIQLLDPMLKFLNSISKKKYNYYPFT